MQENSRKNFTFSFLFILFLVVLYFVLSSRYDSGSVVTYKQFEEQLEKGNLSDDQIMALVRADSDLKFKSDIFGSPEYKRYLLSVTIADLAKVVKGGKR